MTKLIQEMSEQDRNKYEEMKKVNEDFLKTIEEYQEQLDMLTNKKLDYEDRISGSQVTHIFTPLKTFKKIEKIK